MIEATRGARLADAPKIGEYWEGQGGIYAGIMPDYDGTEPRFLIFAEEEAVSIPWGAVGALEQGARDKDDGRVNTQHLADCDQGAHEHPAAKFASRYEKDGHRDFYLPSRRELNVAYATIPDTFDQTDLYWSSTEHSRTMAWGRSAANAEFDRLFKHMPARARPVRTLPVIDDAQPT